MKKQTTTLFAHLGETAVRNLTNIVRETLALDQQIPQPKKFTASDLWSIQRQKKVTSGRRRFI